MGREKLIKLLRAKGEGYVSGEELSETLGITRAGIWKEIETLRADGYDIEAKKSAGYRLLSAPDALTAEGDGLRAFLDQCHALTSGVRRSDEIALPYIP